MNDQHILVVGAGLCGTLLALRMAQRGFRVSLMEKRGPIPDRPVDSGRSINLALSDRGIWALDKAGVKSQVIDECIPMQGRMIHPPQGQPFFSPYSGRPQAFINSVSRSGLNQILLEQAHAMNNIEIKYYHRCLRVDLKEARAIFKNLTTGNMVELSADVVVGTDGAGSAVRTCFMKATGELRFDYSQNFLNHGYKELSIKPNKSGDYRLEKNALHIWPRSNCMLIALPNTDGSFTATLFNPYNGSNGFNEIKSPEQVQRFFGDYYPDFVAHSSHYQKEFQENPVGILGTIRCYPWQAFGKVLLMGDAAHAIVPFYGQGMNASFEDVRIFDELLDKPAQNWHQVFTEFQKKRKIDAEAIADLALDNFREMRDRVDDPDFIRKRAIERELEQQYPDYYSKYSLVTFKPDLPYSQAKVIGRKQDQYLLNLCRHEIMDSLDLDAVYRHLSKLSTAAPSTSSEGNKANHSTENNKTSDDLNPHI